MLLSQWQDLNPEMIMEYKLKCVFENPVSSTTTGKVAAVPNAPKSETNTTNGKNKATGDAAKTSSKVKI